MTTRKDINDLCRRRLGDQFSPNEFTDLQINQWINDAIADYSIYFPRQIAISISTQAGTCLYPLENIAGLRSVLSVSYPSLEGECTYLTRRSERDRRGFYGRPVYDLKPDQTGHWVLVLGLTPPEGETISMLVEADHLYLASDPDETTVPDLHLELLVLFVRAAAMQEQLAQMSAQNEPSSLLLSTLGANANRALNEYQQKKREFLAGMSAGGMIQVWEN